MRGCRPASCSRGRCSRNTWTKETGATSRSADAAGTDAGVTAAARRVTPPARWTARNAVTASMGNSGGVIAAEKSKDGSRKVKTPRLHLPRTSSAATAGDGTIIMQTTTNHGAQIALETTPRPAVAAAALCSAWTSVSERKPTIKDCDKWGDLWLWIPSLAEYGAQCTNLESLSKATHWMSITDGTLQQPSPPNAEVDLPDTAAQDSASKSNNPAVSG